MATQQSAKDTGRRRGWAWVAPLVAIAVGQAFARPETVTVDLHDRWPMTVMFFAGVAGGAAWQWLARRDLADRLFGVSLLFCVVMLLFLLPGEGDIDRSASFLAVPGVVAGLVITERFLRRRTPAP